MHTKYANRKDRSMSNVLQKTLAISGKLQRRCNHCTADNLAIKISLFYNTSGCDIGWTGKNQAKEQHIRRDSQKETDQILTQFCATHLSVVYLLGYSYQTAASLVGAAAGKKKSAEVHLNQPGYFTRMIIVPANEEGSNHRNFMHGLW